MGVIWRTTTIAIAAALMIASRSGWGVKYSAPTELAMEFEVKGELEPPTASWVPTPMLSPMGSKLGGITITIPHVNRTTRMYVSLSDDRKGQGDVITFEGPEHVTSKPITPLGRVWKKEQLSFGYAFTYSAELGEYEDLVFDVYANKGTPAEAYPLLPGKYSGTINIVYMTE
ncbi:hypothetical protein J4198_005497 [Salmonella enterica]|nr:hypothetical protein [Salmonella enterica]